MMRSLRLAAALACLGSTGALAGEIAVFAAASLSAAFEEIADGFEETHPDVEVRIVCAGSQQLAFQIGEGAPADVFASADLRWMERVHDRGLLAGPPEIFARNRLVVILPRSNPGSIQRLGDLARDGVQLVTADPAVPLGAYTRSAFERLAETPELAASYPARVLRNVVSLEESATAVVGKILLGEADAGFVYRSDVAGSAAGQVRQLDIPEECNPIAEYPIALVAGARFPHLARAFVDSVLSVGGQRALARHGFVPVPRARAGTTPSNAEGTPTR